MSSIDEIKAKLNVLEIERQNIKKSPYGGAPLVVEALRVEKEYKRLKEELKKHLDENN